MKPKKKVNNQFEMQKVLSYIISKLILPPMNASPAPFVSTILFVGILVTGYCDIFPSKNNK